MSDSQNERIYALACLKPFEGSEAEMVEVLRDFYEGMRSKDYSHDLLCRDAQNTRQFIHLRRWRSAEARLDAAQDPMVQNFWKRLSVLCEITVASEDMDPIFCSFPRDDK